MGKRSSRRKRGSSHTDNEGDVRDVRKRVNDEEDESYYKVAKTARISVRDKQT
ncbi:hypothetical protein ACS0TY_007074 [Phlomoides rotata]